MHPLLPQCSCVSYSVNTWSIPRWTVIYCTRPSLPISPFALATELYHKESLSSPYTRVCKAVLILESPRREHRPVLIACRFLFPVMDAPESSHLPHTSRHGRLAQYLKPPGGAAVPTSLEMIPIVPNSLGDIVAAAQLALVIYESLSDSRGAPYELNCFVEELRSFADALLSLSKIVYQIKLSPNEPFAKNIINEAAACLDFLKKVRDGIEPYEIAFARERGSFRKIWYKICWGVLKPKEITMLRKKVSQRTQNIVIWVGVLEM